MGILCTQNYRIKPIKSHQKGLHCGAANLPQLGLHEGNVRILRFSQPGQAEDPYGARFCIVGVTYVRPKQPKLTFWANQPMTVVSPAHQGSNPGAHIYC